jgi:hypothetical protein
MWLLFGVCFAEAVKRRAEQVRPHKPTGRRNRKTISRLPRNRLEPSAAGGQHLLTNRVLLDGRQLKHLNEVHRAPNRQSSLRVGHLNDPDGWRPVNAREDAEQADFRCNSLSATNWKLRSPYSPCHEMARRVLQNRGSSGHYLGVIVLNSYRVEKASADAFLELAAIRNY